MDTATKYIVIVLTFVILIGGVAALVMVPRTDRTNGPAPEPSVNVVLAVVKPTTLPDAILFPASVEAYKSVKVAAEISGVVESIGVEEGAPVKEGQEIARVSTRTVKAQLDQAQADYELAQGNFNRTTALHEQKIASDEQYQLDRAALAVRKARLEDAKITFEKATIAAPVSGTLNRKYIEKGEYVKPGDMVAEIVEVDTVKVVVDVPEKDINYVSAGMLLGVVVDGDSDFALPQGTQAQGLAEALKQAVADRKVILGTSSYRSVVADSKTRTYRVEVKVANSDRKLLPGMIVRVVLLRRMLQDTIAAPLLAVVPRDGRAAVYVEEGGRARERTVTLGVTDGRNIQITSGLAAGDKLIVEGQRQLKDGTKLNVIGADGKPVSGESAVTGATGSVTPGESTSQGSGDDSN